MGLSYGVVVWGYFMGMGGILWIQDPVVQGSSYTPEVWSLSQVEVTFSVKIPCVVYLFTTISILFNYMFSLKQ